MARILVVDDSKELLEVFSMIFSLNDLEVETASTKAGLFEKLTSFIPDVILLDVLLGGDNGRELCSAIKNNILNKPIKIILVSGSPELLSDFQQCGADDILEKPFSISTLTEKIKKLLTPAVAQNIF